MKGMPSFSATATLPSSPASEPWSLLKTPSLARIEGWCPEYDGAGFVRRSGATLRANAARKDEDQIVCALCSGLGKLNQIDK
ncbi:hypothetical protein K1719_002455 [Acacia pycnantha]|nr:hypothetical protein K1719_002455 [Acacia pycnantha]